MISKIHVQRVLGLFVLIFTFHFAMAQSLPFDFENDITTADFIDFDGGTATVLANPQSGGINTSATVAQIIRDGGQVFAGSKIELDDPLDFTTLNTITMKVYTSAPAGTTIKLKLENANGAAEVDRTTTVSNAWEELRWDFTGTPADFNTLVFMFDFGNLGDGSATSTFFFDDVMQVFGGTQIDLPVDFEGTEVNYTLSDFEGNQSFLTTDPEDGSNTVVQILKDAAAGSSAGTTIGTPAGFATNIPLTLTDSKMNVKVWSPAAGTPIRLKVEDANDPTHTCETETNSSINGGWEVLEFDFTNQAPGTELLSVGLAQGWIYNKASIFFNFGTDGATAGEQIYYFDDVRFGPATSSTNISDIEGLKVYPNPASEYWMIASPKSAIHYVTVHDFMGRSLKQMNVQQSKVRLDASGYPSGIYLVRIQTEDGEQVVRVVRE